ncbi:50S ribosomal protein L22 [Candidatus Micrarchaeota archaeon]|nr:50S ribosomal protein L22 [Candidatus Micrarchaeota archaeon]
MGLYKYSLKPAAAVGKAQGHDWDASYKDLTQVCRAIRGLPVKKAFHVMQDAINQTRAIQYVRFAKGAGHRSNLGGKQGRYPKKECRLMTKLLRNAVNNAVQNGLDESSLVVKHASANKQNVFRRYRQFWVSGTVLGYGKHATWANYVTARAEIVLRGKTASEEKTEKPKKAKTKKATEKQSEPRASPEKNVQDAEEKTGSKPEKSAKPQTQKPPSKIETPAFQENVAEEKK